MKLVFLSIIYLANACRILALSGGGAHAAFQAGVIKRLHEEGNRWTIITGISAGSFNAGLISLFKEEDQSLGIKLMESLWQNITSKNVYNYNWNPIYDQSILDSSPLNNTIYTMINQFGPIKRDIIIGSVSLNTGLMRLFNMTDFQEGAIRTTNIMLASSAIPSIFPPIFLDDEYYVDGGTFSNELIIAGINYCLDNGYPNDNITIDTIICSQPIENITNDIIKDSTIIGIAERTYDILSNALFNHELYGSCNKNKEIEYTYPMYIYKPVKEFNGSLFDFNHEDLIASFSEGYNVGAGPVKPTKYCLT
ncbi:MAG: patatin-like phospholipase family protein [Barrevirus sp.]|uniref:Patatin-like phospholipase family protein n=1 Tax=Barrevirus sp. TaxID=2487763 RepID=A0A3G4ZPX2_9VIRU|nr:MAG: patatin-like phospholipase family protein [Barrevirus sp.]